MKGADAQVVRAVKWGQENYIRKILKSIPHIGNPVCLIMASYSGILTRGICSEGAKIQLTTHPIGYYSTASVYRDLGSDSSIWQGVFYQWHSGEFRKRTRGKGRAGAQKEPKPCLLSEPAPGKI